MAQALTRQSIRETRELAERKIRESELNLARWRGVMADVEASERILDLIEQGESEPPIAAKAVNQPPPMFYGGGPSFSVRNPFRQGTNKAFIWEVFDQSKEVWLNANQIQERASELKGEVIPMASISPMLSEMKGEYLERDNLLVALKSRLNENGEAEASPDADEVTASSDQ